MTFRALPPILALAFASILLGGCATFSAPQLAATLLIQLGLFVCIGYAVVASIRDRSAQIAVTVAIAAALSALLATVALRDTANEDRERDQSPIRFIIGLLDPLGVSLAAAFFGVVVGLGGIFAILIVCLTSLNARIGLYLSLVSPWALVAHLNLTLGYSPNTEKWNRVFRLRDLDDIPATVLLGSMIGLCSGSILAAGFLTGDLVIPIVILILGTGCIAHLARRAWSATAMREKFGVYAVASILSYELWLLLEAVVQDWDTRISTLASATP